MTKVLFNMELFLWMKCIRIRISRPPPGIGDAPGVIFATVPGTDPPSWIKQSTNLESYLGLWPTVISPILSTFLIVILQKYGLVSIHMLLVSFKTLTCWCNVMFREVVSPYAWYPLLPIRSRIFYSTLAGTSLNGELWVSNKNQSHSP